MKYLIMSIYVAALAGCGVVHNDEIQVAVTHCESHGGVKKIYAYMNISNGGTFSFVCADGIEMYAPQVDGFSAKQPEEGKNQCGQQQLSHS